jgi:hypothetical protein
MIRFKVNGADKTYDGDPEMPLLCQPVGSGLI